MITLPSPYCVLPLCNIYLISPSEWQGYINILIYVLYIVKRWSKWSEKSIGEKTLMEKKAKLENTFN